MMRMGLDMDPEAVLEVLLERDFTDEVMFLPVLGFRA